MPEDLNGLQKTAGIWLLIPAICYNIQLHSNSVEHIVGGLLTQYGFYVFLFYAREQKRNGWWGEREDEQERKMRNRFMIQ
jgi:hypothetical protein